MHKVIWNFIVDKVAHPFIEGLAPYRDSGKTVTKQLPGYYGHWYLLSIPIFAAIYWMPFFVLHIEESRVDEYFQFLYFSAVTITTLGYGDITPTNLPAMLLTGVHSVIGVGLIGLFLNSLSHQHSEEIGQEERKKLTEDFQNTVTEIKKSSENMVEEIRESSQEMLNQITGGDSFPIMDINQNSPNENMYSFVIRCEGRYPI